MFDREGIRELFIRERGEASVSEMNNRDVETLFWIYDRVVLDNRLKRWFDSHPYESVEFSFERFGYPGEMMNLGPNGEMIDTVGISGHCQTVRRADSTLYRILLSHSILGGLTFEKERSSNGILCFDQLTCLMITLEHEIAHLLIAIEGVEDAEHDELFLSVVERLFGHTSTVHRLDG